MRTTLMLLTALGLLLGCGDGTDRADREIGAAGDQPGTDTMTPATAATTDTAGDAGLAWGPAPPGLPAGAQMAVISGDPAKPGPFTVRVQMPPDYVLRPHYHPMREELRLLEGTLHVGRGEKWDQGAMKEVAPNQPVMIEPRQPSFLHAASRVVIEVQSTGPFAITYVDPKDDPRNGSTP